MKKNSMGFSLVWMFMPFVLWGASDPFAEMAIELSAKAEISGVRRVAVLEFKMVNSGGSVGGRVVQERLISALVNKGTVSVVERDRLDEIKKELTLGMTGLLDETTTKRIGKVLGVDGLVVGSLSDQGKGSWEANTRLVLVETGEILGAVTKELKQTWMQPGPESSLSDIPLKGWRLPTDLERYVSTNSAPGTVLFKNTSPIGSRPLFIQMILVEETAVSVTVDLEYFLPPEFKDKAIWIFLNAEGFQQVEKPGMVGQNVARLTLSAAEEYLYFTATSRFVVSMLEEGPKGQFSSFTESETIPFRKIWLNPFAKGEGFFLKTNPSMRISRVDPTSLLWEKQFTIYGEFRGVWQKHASYVVLGGSNTYLRLKILDWKKDRIVAKPPKSGRRRGFPLRIDPDLPYFVSVVVGEEHSNLFLFKFDPEGLPEWE